MAAQSVDELLDLTESGGDSFGKNEVENYNIEKEKIHLAKWVLAGLAILFVISVSCYCAKFKYIDNDAAKAVFGFVMESFPPIVTLVLGAYFTRKSD